MRLVADKRTPVGDRFAWANLASASIALLVASLALSAFQFFSLRSALLDDLQVQLHIVGDNGSAAIRFGDRQTATELLEALERSPSVIAASFFESTGKPVATYARNMASGIDRVPYDLLPSGYRFTRSTIELVEPVKIDEVLVGYIVMRATLDQLYARLIAFGAATMLVGAAALGLSFLLVARLRRAVHQAERRLAHLAHVDAVTGLPNRNSYREHIEAAAHHAQQTDGGFALLLLDIDNFKTVNDTLGHAGGDELLKLVGQRLTKTLRGSDTVCRIGGDEFTIIAQGIDRSSDATRVAENVVFALAGSFHVGERELWATASVGVTIWPQDARDLTMLLRNADTAMYAAKSAGRNTYKVFRPEMNVLAVERLNLEGDLRRALDAGLLGIHYQPQLDLRAGTTVSVEALARWSHPVRGLIPPSEFIPIAEQSGLIGKLDTVVLRKACADAAMWNRARARPLVIAVNLSARDIVEETLFDEIAEILFETGLSPKLLEIEITESVFMGDVKASLHTLQRLRSLGVRLAIDDFGTGYSSMAYLKGMPVDRLKIDRAFVRDLAQSDNDRQLTAAMIAMAHALGLEVVAEGVETPGQVAILAKLECDIVQGYIVSRPLTAEAFVAWLDADRCARVRDDRACAPALSASCDACPRCLEAAA